MTTFDPNKSNTNPNQSPRGGSANTGKPQAPYTQVQGGKTKGGKGGDKGGKGKGGCGSC